MKMRKQDFARWVKEIDEEFLALGGEKVTNKYDNFSSYLFNTRYGVLTMHIAHPIVFEGQRIKYTDCTLFGRFAGNSHHGITKNISGKWNFHYGARRDDEVTDCVDDICNNLARIICSAEEVPTHDTTPEYFKVRSVRLLP